MTLKIERLPIEKLTFDPANARKHSDVNLSAIAESLRQFGQRKPIVVNAENVIVAGNGTVEAARLLGLTDVDVVRVPKDWSADQVKAFALADNRTAEMAEWDPEVLSEQLFELQAAGFDVDVIGFAEFSYERESFEPVSDVPRLDEKEKKLCPNCGHIL
jgi:ParB-like chromosome segregation protein Spo0J